MRSSFLNTHLKCIIIPTRQLVDLLKKTLCSMISDIHRRQEENAGGEALLNYPVSSC